MKKGTVTTKYIVKKISYKVINYIGDSLKLCHETARHTILSQGKKNHVLQSDLAGQTAHRREVYGDYVTSQTKGTLMALQEDIKPVIDYFLFLKGQKHCIFVPLKGINLWYLAQMKSHLKYYSWFWTGPFRGNLGKKAIQKGGEK